MHSRLKASRAVASVLPWHLTSLKVLCPSNLASSVCWPVERGPYLLIATVCSVQHSASLYSGTAQHLVEAETNASPEPTPEQQRADVSLLRPEMQQQWYHEFNTVFAGKVVKPYSNKLATWSCDKCPDGHLHVWQSQVRRRSRGTGCPYCSSKFLCSHNSLEAQAPEVASSWDYEKNQGSIPAHYHQFSRRLVHWKCGICGHKWQARIKDRTERNTGCKACYLANRSHTRLPTLAEAKPDIMSQWHHARNQAENLHPERLTLGSNTPVWWLCNECRHGKPHEWQQSPHARKYSGCPYCAHRRVCVCNSLATKFPQLAAEMDNANNTLKSNEIMPWSNIEVQWKSAERGLWTQQVRYRTEGAAQGHFLYDKRSNKHAAFATDDS